MLQICWSEAVIAAFPALIPCPVLTDLASDMSDDHIFNFLFQWLSYSKSTTNAKQFITSFPLQLSYEA